MLIDARCKATEVVSKARHGEGGYLRTPAAAAYLGLSKTTLEKMRHRNAGPKYLRLGSKVVAYAVSDLDEWAAQGAVPGTQVA